MSEHCFWNPDALTTTPVFWPSLSLISGRSLWHLRREKSRTRVVLIQVTCEDASTYPTGFQLLALNFILHLPNFPALTYFHCHNPKLPFFTLPFRRHIPFQAYNPIQPHSRYLLPNSLLIPCHSLLSCRIILLSTPRRGSLSPNISPRPFMLHSLVHSRQIFSLNLRTTTLV